VSVQSTPDTQNSCNKHTKAHRRPKHQPRTLSATILHQHLSLTVALKRSHGLLKQGWSTSPSLFLCLSLCLPSSLLLAWVTGQVYPGVPVTDNLIVNGLPGTQGLTPLQFCQGAQRGPMSRKPHTFSWIVLLERIQPFSPTRQSRKRCGFHSWAFKSLRFPSGLYFPVTSAHACRRTRLRATTPCTAMQCRFTATQCRFTAMQCHFIW